MPFLKSGILPSSLSWAKEKIKSYYKKLLPDLEARIPHNKIQNDLTLFSGTQKVIKKERIEKDSISKFSLQLFANTPPGSANTFIERMEQIAGVDSVDIVENIELSPVNSLPPLSVSFIISGGAEADIGQAFAELGAIPFRTVGTEFVEVTNTAGRPVRYYFTRPVSVEVESIEIIFFKKEESPLSEEFKNNYKNRILDYINTGVKDSGERNEDLTTSLYASSLASFPKEGKKIEEDVLITFTIDGYRSEYLQLAYYERPFVLLDNISIQEILL